MEAVVCFSHLRWNFVFQRPQHIMVRLAKSRRVLYIEEPMDAPPTASPRLQTEVHAASGVVVVTPLLPAGATDEQRCLWMKSLVHQLLHGEQIVRPVLWYYTPMMRAISREIDAACIVYDCMDELANFRFAPPTLTQLEDELFAVANVVFTGGASLYDSKRTRHNNVHLFPSSVETEHFASARLRRTRAARAGVSGSNTHRSTDRRANAEHAALDHVPTFGFHGVIDERMDVELLGQVASARPDWAFEIIGPVVKIDPAGLPSCENISYLGPKLYTDLPNYLAGWDVAIMPFAINDATKFISPTKTPEYFAGGLPVVSTPITDVVRRYGHLLGLRVAATPHEFIVACEQALLLSETNDAWLSEADAVLALDSWDSTVRQMAAAVFKVTAASAVGEPTFARGTLSSKRRRPYDYLVVGAGFAGSVLAERLASQANKRVLVIDRRSHIAGNAFDEYDAAGILVHRYGPHIFHTNSDRILAYLSEFTTWRQYEHRVLAAVKNKLVPLPINRTTLNLLYNLHLTSDAEAQAFLQSKAVQIDDVQSAEELILATVGTELYETFFQCYTRKQWGMDASTLDKSVTARVPARVNTDDRYFTDKHQCMPKHGYTRLFENLLSHDNIDVMVGVDFADVNSASMADHVIFSGPVDEYFGYRHGPLQYRSLQFQRVTVSESQFQPVGVVNYPSADVAYTRITEYKHLTGQQCARSSLSYEYPCDEGEPYYPVPTADNQARYQQYAQLAAKTHNVSFVGRLGTYRYYNMDQVVGQALATFQRLTESAAPSPVRQVRSLPAHA